MAQQTICPACGAPIEYNGQGDQIRCPFCDTELKVVEEGDTTRFQVLSQPGPQKEVLSQPVDAPGRPDMETTFANFSMDENAPTAGSSGTEVPLPPASEGAFYTPPVGASVSTPGTSTGRSGVGRWVAIGAIALLALCGLCACLGFVAFAVMRNNGGGF